MLNRNALKSIMLPKSSLKNTNGNTLGSYNFDISSAYYTGSKTGGFKQYYMGLFNTKQNLDVNTYSLEGEIIIPSDSSTYSYVNDTAVDAMNIITLTRTITNKTSGIYIINTIGLVFQTGRESEDFALMSCERIPTVTIKPTETYTFTHKIKIG